MTPEAHSRIRRSAATIITMITLLTACTPSSQVPAPPTPETPTYTPIPDAQLYEQIAALPGITKVDISYVDRFGASNYYSGLVEISDSSDPEDLLDRVIAILRQGHFNAGVDSVGIARINGTRQTPPDFAIPIDPVGLTERYGPQPGDGIPPGKEPLPTQSPPAPISTTTGQ